MKNSNTLCIIYTWISNENKSTFMCYQNMISFYVISKTRYVTYGILITILCFPLFHLIKMQSRIVFFLYSDSEFSFKCTKLRE